MSKKKDTSWMASGLRGVGVVGTTMAVDVEAVGVGVDTSGAALGVSTLSVVGLLGTGINSPDMRDTGVMGSECMLDSAHRIVHENH